MSLARRLAQQLEIPTPLSPARAVLVLEHCTYQLRHRDFLFNNGYWNCYREEELQVA